MPYFIAPVSSTSQLYHSHVTLVTFVSNTSVSYHRHITIISRGISFISLYSHITPHLHKTMWWYITHISCHITLILRLIHITLYHVYITSLHTFIMLHLIYVTYAVNPSVSHQNFFLWRLRALTEKEKKKVPQNFFLWRSRASVQGSYKKVCFCFSHGGNSQRYLSKF